MWKLNVLPRLRRHAARACASTTTAGLSTQQGPSATQWAAPACASAVVGVVALTAMAMATPPPVEMEAAYGSSSSTSSPRGERMRMARRFTRRATRRHRVSYHRYVVVGCGTAAQAAIEAIRHADPKADILILSDERALPRVESQHAHQRSRPEPMEDGGEDGSEEGEEEVRLAPVSEPLLQTYNEWRRHIAQVLEEDDTPMEHGEAVGGSGDRDGVGGSGATMAATTPVTLLMPTTTRLRFDAEAKRILLSDGSEIRYDTCLVASSGRPRHFYVLDSDRITYEIKDRINTCTTWHDFEQLSALPLREGIARVAIVGGGFLGTEVATAIATDPRRPSHRSTQLLFAEDAPGSRSLPPYLADSLASKLERVGVEVLPHRLVTRVKCEGESVETDGVVITTLGGGSTSMGTKVPADYVILASTHTEPNLKLERASGFEMDERHGGIVVNAQLEAMAGLFVAGNAASYYDPYLGRRRVDRYDHAVNSGLLAGSNMVAAAAEATASVSTTTGAPRTQGRRIYRHQPLFRSNLSGLGVQIEGIGQIDASLHTIGVWVQAQKTGANTKQAPVSYDRGIVYYVKGNKIMGILLWNAGDLMDNARQLLLSHPEVLDDAVQELKQAISLGPEDWLHVVTT